MREVCAMTRQTSGAVDLEGVERWSRETMRRDTTKLMEEFLGSHVRERLENEAKLAAGDNLALIARVRELEAEVATQKAIISTGMSAFSYGRSQGREEGVAVERKRCAEVARSVADEMDGRATRATWVGKAIAAAIERGDK